MDRDAIEAVVLEAAALLVREEGAEAISIEVLAAATELDEGAIRAVYPDIEELTKAAVGRIYASVLGDVADAVGDDDEPGAFTRGYVRVADPDRPDRDDFARLVAALLGSSPYRPEFAESVRAEQATLRAAFDNDGIDPVSASIIRLAVYGLWLNDLFRIEPVTPERRREVIARLVEMARPPATATASGGTATDGAARDGAAFDRFPLHRRDGIGPVEEPSRPRPAAGRPA